MKSCQKARGHLASTSSEEELTFLHKTFVENNPDGKIVNVHVRSNTVFNQVLYNKLVY